LEKPADKVQGKTLADIGIGHQNVLDVWDGYARGKGRWEPDDRTPTRLEDRPTVTLRLARVRDGAVVPYAEDADASRAWALSEVSVARYHIADCPPPAGLDTAVGKARETWARWERESDRMLLAVLTEAEDGHRFDARAESGAVVAATYSNSIGLQWTRSAPR
jgi:CRISPR-associated endonuclease/helicase Cas3